MSKRRTLNIIILSFVIVIGLTISLWPVLSGVFPFTFDQGRDLLWVKNQVDFGRPSLIGPWGSLSGVFFGPLWFWLLTIPYLLSGGSPVAVTIFNALVVYSAVIVAGWLLKRHSKRLGYFIVLLGFSSFGVQSISRFAFSQHQLPLLTIFLIYAYAQVLFKSSRRYFWLACLLISLFFHAEPPICLFSLPSLFIILYFSPQIRELSKLKTLFLGAVFLIIPFIPLILFDLRHNFVQSQAVLSYLIGQNQSLGDILSFGDRLLDRPRMFFEVFKSVLLPGPVWLSLLLLIGAILVNWKMKMKRFLKKLWQASLIYVISLLVIFTFYPPQLKPFYLDGLLIVFLLWAALAFSSLWQRKSLRKPLVMLLGVILFQNLQPISFIKSAQTGFENWKKEGSVFINQKEAVNWVYEDAHGKGFKVYTYVGPVYDYPYQYLFFWHGLKKHGYLPEEFSYLPDQTEYVQKKSEQLGRLESKIKLAEDRLYLIIENEGYLDRKEKWLGNFNTDDFPIIKEELLRGNIQVQKRKSL